MIILLVYTHIHCLCTHSFSGFHKMNPAGYGAANAPPPYVPYKEPLSTDYEKQPGGEMQVPPISSETQAPPINAMNQGSEYQAQPTGNEYQPPPSAPPSGTTYPPEAYPLNTYPPQTYPPGTTYPPEAYPSTTYPPEAYTYPPETYPPTTY